MTNSTLKIDQGKLFAALDHNPHTMGLALALLEVITGDRVEVDFAAPNLNRDVAFNRDQILKALGIGV
jgi:hypothetical protein